jgi:hypothetical protein
LTREQRLEALAQQLGIDVHALEVGLGNLAALTTTAKTSVVVAINEVRQMVLDAVADGGGAAIDDAAVDGATDVVYSADKVLDLLAALETKVKNDLTGGASAALDTLGEIEAELGSQDTALSNLLTAVGETVRFTAQAPTAEQQTQARANIGAGSAADLDALELAMGDPDTDLLAIYQAAKA